MKKTLILILGLIVLVVGFCFFVNKNSEQRMEDKIVYQNLEYGFQLDMPMSWQGYMVTRENDIFWFGLAEEEKVFNISVLSEDEFEEIKKANPNFEERILKLLNRDGKVMIFNFQTQSILSESMEDRRAEVPEIVESFRLSEVR